MQKRTKLPLPSLSYKDADQLASRILEDSFNQLGFIPNLFAKMAHNSALLDGYKYSLTTFKGNSGFSPLEQEVIFLSIAYENDCPYCQAVHTYLVENSDELPQSVKNIIDSNESETTEPRLRALSLFTRVDEKLQVLSEFCRRVTALKGRVPEQDVKLFLENGYEYKHILGIIAAIGIKTMSNYLVGMFDIPTDEQFKPSKAMSA